MTNNKREKIGSVYYDKKSNKWRCIYYIYDTNTLNETRKTKSFLTEEEAKDFLTSIQCQKGNELFIRNNGIPLNEMLKTMAKKKYDTNVIKGRSI